MSKEYLTYENKILGQEIERLAKEVEKLEKVNQMLLNSMVTEAHTKETKEIERLKNGCKELEQQIDDLYKLETTLTNENERLNNIIGEAIEYIEENSDDMHTYISQVLTDILKGSDKE